MPKTQNNIIMNNFKELVQLRCSQRKFTEIEVDSEDVKLILRAALMSPTSTGKQAWQFIVVDNKSDIEKISDSKNRGSIFLKNAPLAIVVLGNPNENDCWIEDASIAAISMQYQAEDLGLGSCWIQIRGRGLEDGTSADDIIHGILNLPDDQHVLCVLAIGHKADECIPQNEENLNWENVHIEKY